MSSDDMGEKTEEATQQRRDDYRKRGQVAQSKELASALILLLGVLMVWALSDFFLTQLRLVFNKSLVEAISSHITRGDLIVVSKFAFTKMVVLTTPVLGVVLVISFMSSVVQIGWLHNEEALNLKWDRLNPISGFKNMFSLKQLVEGIKSFIKMGSVMGLAYLILHSEIDRIPQTVTYNVEQSFALIGVIVVKLLAFVGLMMLFLSLFDFFYQKYNLEQQMKMSKQEVKEEHKSREGDPLIKSRIRRLQRDMAQSRMMSEVPKADVIITNPTHIAVALKYSKDMVAPKIIAMGADLIAQKIKELAKENSIPIVENKPLARTMFKTLEVGRSIPIELYSAVAEVLSYIYKLKNKVLA